jgi:hypothetical protein
VEHFLVHSSTPLAAAIAADNIDSSYVQMLINDGYVGEFSDMIGAPALGKGFQVWLEKAPGFNSDKVRSPLRLETDTGGPLATLSHWELYSGLKRLQKPVELYVIPDSRYADHPPQIPAQKLASAGGTVDWMDFWLNGHEDPSAAKAEQYRRWRALRELLPSTSD